MRWVQLIDERSDLGRDRERVADHAADVVEALFVRPAGIGAALRRFGTRLGAEGWPLEHVSDWIDLLGDLCPQSSDGYLRSFGSGVALANGWTEGHLRGMRADEHLDPVTGLCTRAMLRLRLHQVYEECAAAGVEPSTVCGLVVIDADLTGVGTLEADAVMIVLADLAGHHFHDHDTIARDGGRIFVLASPVVTRIGEVERFVESSRERGLLRAAHVLGWREDLPPSTVTLDRYLADLSV